MEKEIEKILKKGLPLKEAISGSYKSQINELHSLFKEKLTEIETDVFRLRANIPPTFAGNSRKQAKELLNKIKRIKKEKEVK